jgi:putative ATPase
MKELGYGKGYVYDHETPDGFSGQSGFPDDMPRQQFYDPPDRGFERDIRKRLDWWAKRRTNPENQIDPKRHKNQGGTE